MSITIRRQIIIVILAFSVKMEQKEVVDMKKTIVILGLLLPLTINQSFSLKNLECDAKLVKIKVNITDLTEENPVHKRAEIWVKGMGSWFFAPELEYGGTTKTIEGQELGVVHKMYIYPDSRDGKEMMVEFMITEEMNPGSVGDATRIDIYDAEVKVNGTPIKAANDGEFEITFER